MKEIEGITGPTDPEGYYQVKNEVPEYTIGDRVRWMDVEGVIIPSADDYWHRYMTVRLDSGRELLFERDGRYLPESNVKLVVIGKEKPRVKKHRYAYNRSGKVLISDHMTDDTAKCFMSAVLDISHYSKLTWTEIECEEPDAEHDS